jgi:hypothetical protein
MNILNRRLIVIIGAAAAFAGSLSAQAIVVTGTGDPRIDVPAVQAAVAPGANSAWAPGRMFSSRLMRS